MDRVLIEQAAWCEGWRKSPLWLRLLGGPKTYYADRGSYRMAWGELSLKWSGFALKVGAHEDAFLNIALGFVQVFIRLPWLDNALTTGANSIEQPSYGFSTFGASLHLNWGRRCKIIDPFWQARGCDREFLTIDGRWTDHEFKRHSWAPEEGIEPLTLALPYHYMLGNGEVQHVTATVTRERVWWLWKWFGESTHPRALDHLAAIGRKPRRAWVSDGLRRLQKRLRQPHHSIDIEFSDEVGERAGSWKGGCTGCSYEMKPGETPQHTLQRMQRERRFH